MNIYQPNQRIVPVEILFQRGWLKANIRVGEINYFVDAINAIPHFLKLSDVVFEGGHKLNFFVLHKTKSSLWEKDKESEHARFASSPIALVNAQSIIGITEVG